MNQTQIALGNTPLRFDPDFRLPFPTDFFAFGSSIAIFESMRKCSWTDAAEIVLAEAHKPMSCTALADEILKHGLRNKSGATPSSSLNAALRWSIAHQSPTRFVQTGPGLYALAPSVKK